jgi:hypothetical protein
MLLSLLFNVLGGVLAGLLASYIFWLYLRSRKPKLSISSEIIKRPHPYHSNLWEYKFRIRNERKNRRIINIRIQAVVNKVGPDDRRRGLGLPLTHDEVFMLPPLSENERLCIHDFTIDIYSLNLDRLAGLGFDEEKKNELKRKIKEKKIRLEDILKEFDFLRVDILATDPASNMTCFLEKRYTMDDIKESYDFVGIKLDPIPLKQKQELYNKIEKQNKSGHDV